MEAKMLNRRNFLKLAGAVGTGMFLNLDIGIVKTVDGAISSNLALHTNPVLRGINWSSWGYRDLHGLTWQKLEDMKTKWNLKIMRFAFNRHDYIYDSSYRQTIKNVTEWCKILQLIIILDYQADTNQIILQPLPDKNNAVALWSMISQDPTYKNSPYVWFDLWNEPYDCTISQWKDVANACIVEIRKHANNNCLVAGLHWAADLRPWRGNYLTESNVIYKCHLYAPSLSSGWYVNIDLRLGDVLSDGKPVFIGETGADFSYSSDRDWLANYALPWFDGVGRRLGIPNTPLGWTAWSMTDFPFLIDSSNVPTPYGNTIQTKLKQNI